MPRGRERENNLLDIVKVKKQERVPTHKLAMDRYRRRVSGELLSGVCPLSHCDYVIRVSSSALKVPPYRLPPTLQSSMKTTLHERLIRAEQQFLLAVVSNDEESLKAFSQKWSQLAHDIENIKAVERLDDHTAHLLFKVSRAIESTSLCMLECRAISEELLTHSIGGFIQDVPLDDRFIAPLHSQAIAPRHLLFSDLPYSKIPKILGLQKVLDSYAYCWLMQNIHEPYPNSVQTRIISDASGVSVAQVEHWFQEVRDSIGWRKLSHKFFAGSVTATVAAARRVYLERDKNVSFEIVFAFTAVKANAEILFPELPPLQGKDVDTGSVQTDQTIAMGQDHHTWPLLDNSIIDPESIPIPPQGNIVASHEPLSDLSDSDGSEEEDTTPPPPIAGFKRLLAEDVFTGQEADLGRPQKRLRCVAIFPLCSSD
jgi:homeobox KN domain-containing protein/mating-type protein beta 1